MRSKNRENVSVNFFTVLGAEYKKIRRSHIGALMLAAAVILWVPSILNAHLNFEMQAEGILPEHNFLIQGLLGFAWFMFPASMVSGTVLLNQTERSNRGILKMLSLPVSTVKLCLAKFTVLVSLAGIQILLAAGMYYISAAIASHTQDYDFMLSPLFVFRQAGIIFVSAVPMLACFWLAAVCIQTPVFSIGTGLASIVPSVLMINTKAWFVYPMAYPFYAVTSEYSHLAQNLEDFSIEYFPWVPAAAGITAACLLISGLCYGRAERR